MTPLHLPPDGIAALRLRERVLEKADVTFRCCPLCAFPRWSSTHADGTGLTTVMLDESLCDSCFERRNQLPLVFELVVLAIRGHALLEKWSTPIRPDTSEKKGT